MNDRREPTHRTVSLVIDEPRGCTVPFEVALPWWQEVAPVIDEAEQRFGTPVVLVRLLDSDGPFPGGHVTYLAEAPGIDPSVLTSVPAELAEHFEPDTKRASYAEVGAPAVYTEWASAALERLAIKVTGTPRQIRTWNLAAIWQFPTDHGPMWMKATPTFLAHEAAVLSHLAATGHVPRLIAGEPGRVLMHHIPGHDGYGIGGASMVEAVDVLLAIQNAADVTTLNTVPVIDSTTFGTLIDGLAERWAPALTPSARARLRILQDERGDRFRAVEEVAPSLVHGDFHGGNLRLLPDRPPVVLDWGDSFIGSPLFDVAALESYEVEGAATIRNHWLERLDVSSEQWTAFEPLATMLLPIVYQRFCDNIEAAEMPYHEHDILPALEASLKTL